MARTVYEKVEPFQAKFLPTFENRNPSIHSRKIGRVQIVGGETNEGGGCR